MLRQYLDLPVQVHILCIGTLINRIGSFVLLFLTFYLTKHLGLEMTFATRCMGVFGLGAIVAALVGGHLADIIGRRTVMMASLFGGAAMLLVLSTLSSETSIMLGILVFALFVEMYRPAAAAMIGDLVRPDQRPQAFGLMYVAINLGFTFGAVIGGKLASYSFQWLFYGDAATTAAYGLLILILIRETLPSRRGGAIEQPDAGPPDETTAASPPAGVSLRDAVAHITRDRHFMLFCLSSLLIALIFMQGFSTLPLYIKSLGYTEEDYGNIIAVNGLLIVAFQLPLTWVFTRFNRMLIILLGGMFIGTGYGLTGLAGPLWQFLLTIVIWTIGEMMQAPFNLAVVTDLAPPDLRARYLGLFSMSFSSALMFGAPIGGEIMARYGPQTLWAVCFCIALVACSIYAVLIGPITRRQAARRSESPNP